jgi:hypothetical protein
MTLQSLLATEGAVEGPWMLPNNWEWRPLGGINGVCIIDIIGKFYIISNIFTLSDFDRSF